MEWNVIYHDVNKDVITSFNIFNHWRFEEDVSADLKKCKTKEEFAIKLRSNLMYYFWSKCEYEVVVSAWCGGMNTPDKKIDIFWQVMQNWEIFLDYVWSNKGGRHGRKAKAD